MEWIKPQEAYLEDYLAACKESYDHHVEEWLPVSPDDFDRWKASALSLYQALESGQGLPEGVPRMITYWCVENSRFIGEVQLRPYLLEEEAIRIGHIGYAVRYTMWNRGFGTQMLSYAVDKLREQHVAPIYIVCHADNVSSNRVSLKAGFVLAETRCSGEAKENLYVLR